MPFNWTFLKIYHYRRGFERKLRKVGLILTKLLFGKDFKEWIDVLTGFVSLGGLLDFKHLESELIAYI